MGAAVDRRAADMVIRFDHWLEFTLSATSYREGGL
jgi:hypothetical protein